MGGIEHQHVPLGDLSVKAGPARRLARILVAPVRRGTRTVRWPTDNARVGNLLYDWLRAWRFQRDGVDYVVRNTAAARPWINLIPALSELTIEPNSVRLWDQREVGIFHRFGVDFNARDIEGFYRGVLERSPMFARQDGIDIERNDVIVANIRRGDYYADPLVASEYSLDTLAYFKLSLEYQLSIRSATTVHFVSDDPAWCVRVLGPSLPHGVRLSVEDVGARSPVTDLARLARARRLILTNSTFSYWGGYLSSVRWGQDGVVVAPSLHSKPRGQPFRSHHLLPEWVVVECDDWPLEGPLRAP